MDTDALVGLGSAVLALASAVASGMLALRANRQAHDLERRTKIQNEIEAAERVLTQYRDPLLDAAQTLQSRAYNIVHKDYFGRYLTCGDPDEERYARDYTVFAVAEYLCWVEIVRRELRFLDVGDVKRNQLLLAHLTQTQVSFQTDASKAPFQIFRGRQRAIAELMMKPTGATEGPRSECLGYAEFCHRLDTEPEFAAWFSRLRGEDIDAAAAGGVQRLGWLQHDLIDLIDFLDPNAVRITAVHRHRMPGVERRETGLIPAQPTGGKAKTKAKATA